MWITDTIRSQLKSLCDKYGVARVARAAGIAPATITKWLNGKTKIMQARTRENFLFCRNNHHLSFYLKNQNRVTAETPAPVIIALIFLIHGKTT